MSNDLLRELVRGAVRADLADRDLADLRERITTLNVIVPSEEPPEFAVKTAAYELGQLILGTKNVLRQKRESDGATRYTVVVVLEPPS